MTDDQPKGSTFSAERAPGRSPRQFAYLSLAQPQRLAWTGALAIASTLVTWFAWTREAPRGPVPAPYSLARFLRPMESNREFRPPGTAPMFDSVSFVDPRHGWAVGEGVPIRTTNGGETWQSASSPSGGFHGVYFVDAQRGWAVGRGGTILATTDGGMTWHSQSSGTSEVLYSVYFVDAKRGWAVSLGGTILATTDGGATWHSHSSGTSLSLFSVHFVDARRGWAVGYGAILATTDGGVTWHSQLSGARVLLYSVHFVDAQRGWAVGVGPGFLSTTDGGVTWQVHFLHVTLGAVHFVDAQRGWAVGDGGMILSTTDGGGTWHAQSSGTSEMLRSVHFVDGQRGWAVGRGGMILATTNGGANWRRKPLPVYWRFCPAWYLLVAPAFLVGLILLNRRRADISQGILGVPMRDSAAETLAQDSLGAHRLVNTLVGFVTNRATLPPLCITVEGPWGTGKSSVLQMIRSQLKKKRAAQTVWFNAWHHQKEDPLLAYLLEAIKREGVPPLLSANGLLFRLDLLAVRLGDQPLQFGIAGAALVTAALFWAGMPIAPLTGILKWVRLPDAAHGPLAALGAFGYFHQTFLRAFGSDPEKLVASSRALLSFGDLRGKTDVRADFQKELKDVVTALEAQQRRLVIFLDDLDRCRPEQVVVVMEAVNFLSAAADCFIFFGTDREKVLTAVGLYYKNLAAEESALSGRPEPEVRRDLAESYLRKMINLRTHVPRPDADERQRYLEKQMPVSRSSWRQPALRAVIVVLAVCIAATAWMQKSGEVKLFGGSAPQAAAVKLPAADEATVAPSTNDVGPKIPDPADRPVLPNLAVPLPQNAPARWPWISAVAATALVGLVFWLRVRLRPDIEDTQDRPEFTEALAAAAPAIWEKGGENPRVAKRLHNMLRFLAASDHARKDRSKDQTWEPNLVGFAAFGQTNRFPARWKWTPTPEQADACKKLCSYTELDPDTLQPADGAEPPRSQAAGSGAG